MLSYSLIFKFSEFGTDDEFLMVTFFYTAYDLSVDSEALGDRDDLLGMLGCEIDLKTVSHVEDLVHFCLVCAALLVDRPEKRRNREEVVLDHADVVSHEMQDLCLSSA